MIASLSQLWYRVLLIWLARPSHASCKTGRFGDISIPAFVSVERKEFNLVASQTTATACALYFINCAKLCSRYKAAIASM